MLGHDGVVGAATAQNAAVDLGMQGLDAAVHHLREAGVIGYFGHLEAGVGQQFGGAAGGQQLDPTGGKAGGEFDNAGFIRNREQGAADGTVIVHRFSSCRGMGQMAAGITRKGPLGPVAYQFIPYFFSFLRRVPRLMPSRLAARVWLPRT